MAAGRFRQGVCVVVLRQTGTDVLVCHRLGSKPDQGWQFPQGGMRSSDTGFYAAAFRELREEIGTDCVERVKAGRKAHRYIIPPERRKPGKRWFGQSHRWILVRLRAPDSAIHFNTKPAEFDGYKWVTAAEALHGIVAFKREAYLSGMREIGLV